MLLKLLNIFIVLYFCFVQIQAANFQDDETTAEIEEFEFRVEKLVASLNSSYESLKPEENFAAHIIKMTTKEILDYLMADIFNGVQILKELNITINFNSCTDKIELKDVMEKYDTCIENRTQKSFEGVKHNFTEAILMSEIKLSEIANQSIACNSSSNVDKCNEELSETISNYYEDILIKVNEVNRYILSSYRNIVRNMPTCATKAIYDIVNMGDLFKCMILLAQNNSSSSS